MAERYEHRIEVVRHKLGLSVTQHYPDGTGHILNLPFHVAEGGPVVDRLIKVLASLRKLPAEDAEAWLHWESDKDDGYAGAQARGRGQGQARCRQGVPERGAAGARSDPDRGDQGGGGGVMTRPDMPRLVAEGGGYGVVVVAKRGPGGGVLARVVKLPRRPAYRVGDRVRHSDGFVRHTGLLMPRAQLEPEYRQSLREKAMAKRGSVVAFDAHYVVVRWDGEETSLVDPENLCAAS